MDYPLTIAGCCRQLLDTSGPKTLTQLAEHVVAEGRSQARYPEMSVSSTLSREERVLRDGDTYHSVPMLLEGRFLTTSHSLPDVGWSRYDTWSRREDPWYFDLSPFPLPTSRETVPSPAVDEGTVCAWRLHDGHPVCEIVARDDLADPASLVEAVRAELPSTARHGHQLRREVLLACLADPQLLRAPVPPLSELFPECAPKPPQPVEPLPRRCSACDGTGWQYRWDEPYDNGWSYDSGRSSDSDLSNGWCRRIERLEEAVFGPGDAPVAGGSTAVVPLALWPES